MNPMCTSTESVSLPMTLEIKAYLLSIGTVRIDLDHIPKTRRSTAGPGAGFVGVVFFSSGGKRVRLTIDPNSPLRIFPLPDTRFVHFSESVESFSNSGNWGSLQQGLNCAVEERGRVIATGYLENPLAHCPEQAYINISESCKFNCKYCSVPLLGGPTKSPSEVMSIVKEAWKRGPFEAISLTSGVPDTPEKECERIVALMPELLKYNVPIGVSIYVFPGCSRILKKAGVFEVKYNIEAANEHLFSEVCPDLSFEAVIDELECAVHEFGRGRVFTNIIMGLGESDEDIMSLIRLLAQRGIISELRPVSENPLRSKDCFMLRPSAKRLVTLYHFQRKIFKQHGLDPSAAMTMCSKCGGCDLIPFRDDRN